MCKNEEKEQRAVGLNGKRNRIDSEKKEFKKEFRCSNFFLVFILPFS